MHWWQLALLGDEARLCSWEGGLDVINLWGNEGVIGGEMGGREGSLRITYIPGRVYRALDISLIHESHVNGTEKVASYGVGIVS